MNIKVTFKSGEVVKVTDFLICMFLMECTTPLETMAIIHAAKVNNSLALILGVALKKGLIPCFDEMKIKEPRTKDEKEKFILKVESTSKSVEINEEFMMRILSLCATPFETLAFIKASQENSLVNKIMFVGEAMGRLPNFQETEDVQEIKNDKKRFNQLIRRFGIGGLLEEE